MQAWAIIVDSFRDAKERKIFWIMIGISGIIAAAMFCISFTDHGIDIMFGSWTFDTSDWQTDGQPLASTFGAGIVQQISDNYLGWLGMIVALVATASIFPSLMEPGNIDIVASKPIDRRVLFMGRYVGAMVFMLVQAAIFVGLTFVVMGVRWGYWAWAYLWVLPLTVLLFSYLFAFSALFGVWTRRAMTSLMMTMVAWFFIFLIQTLNSLMLMEPEFDTDGRWRRTAAAVHWVVPKTQDIPIIAGKLLGGDSIGDVIAAENLPRDARRDFHEAMAAERAIKASVKPLASIGSSLAIEAALILLAMWRFNRRDF